MIHGMFIPAGQSNFPAWSPKPRVAGSSPVTPAINRQYGKASIFGSALFLMPGTGQRGSKAPIISEFSVIPRLGGGWRLELANVDRLDQIVRAP
jgi:hypothetical protein